MLLRKLMVLLMVVAATLVLASGVALAADFIGTSGNDTLVGTNGDDYLKGRAGDDILDALGGDDTIEGGRDDDLIYARDTDSFDYIDCGGGFDQVETIHRDDVTLSNCERALGPRRGDIPD